MLSPVLTAVPLLEEGWVMVITKRFLWVDWEPMLAESLGVSLKAAFGAGCLP